MRKLAIMMALASTALASPAVARDHSFYVGLEGGAMLVEDSSLTTKFLNRNLVRTTVDDGYVINYKTGLDADVIGGYDFGMFRLEGELGYKRASVRDINVNALVVPLVGRQATVNVGGRTRALSAMINGLLDFGNDSGLNGYVGAGIGYAKVRQSFFTDYTAVGTTSPALVNSYDTNVSDSDGSLAFQLIAGVRYAITDNIDFGVKYRFFNASKIDLQGANGTNYRTKFRSHSLLASLIYNFASPPPPPPEPTGERG